MTKTPGTPCVGICSSGIGDDVCRGCKRFAHEVINWNAYTDSERALIQQRLDQFLVQIIELTVQIFDRQRLGYVLKQEGIVFDESAVPHFWVYDLLKMRRRDHLDTELWGFRVRTPYQHLSCAALHELIDREFYALSQAHYERYIRPGLKAEAEQPRLD